MNKNLLKYKNRGSFIPLWENDFETYKKCCEFIRAKILLENKSIDKSRLYSGFDKVNNHHRFGYYYNLNGFAALKTIYLYTPEQLIQFAKDNNL